MKFLYKTLYGDCNLQSGWKVSKIEEREERTCIVMLTSQLRECKQMEGCVPQGGTAPRAIAIAKLVSA
jgi:hypothetical protein